MLRRPWTMFSELVDAWRPRDLLVRTEAGEGAIAAGGSDGDRKRLLGCRSMVLLSVLRTAMGKKGRTGQKSVMCPC